MGLQNCDLPKLEIRKKIQDSTRATLKSPKQRNFFRLPTLTGHSFWALWAMMMNSSSFESLKSYLFEHYLKNSSLVLLRYVILSWKLPIYYINRALMILNCPPLNFWETNLPFRNMGCWHCLSLNTSIGVELFESINSL